MAQPIIYPPVYRNGYYVPGQGYSYPTTPSGYVQAYNNQYYANALAHGMPVPVRTYNPYLGVDQISIVNPRAAYGNANYDYQRAENAFRREQRKESAREANAIEAAHPDVDKKAINAAIAIVKNARNDIASDARAIENMHKQMVSRFGIEDGEKAMEAVGINVPTYMTSKAVEREERKETLRAKAAAERGDVAKDDGKIKVAPKGGASFLGSLLGLAAGGFLGYMMMNTYGGGFSVIGVIAMAIAAGVGAMVGGKGGEFVGKMFSKQPEQTPSKERTPARTVSVAEKQAERDAAAEAKRMEEAKARVDREKENPPPAPAVEASGVEAPMPTSASPTPAQQQNPQFRPRRP